MLTTLRRIVLDFGQEVELQSALDKMVSQVKAAMNIDCCSVYLADYQQEHFLLMATDGLEQSSVGHVAIGFSEGLVGLVGQREEPLNIADAQAHPRFKYAPEVNEDDLKAFLGAPIIHQRKVLGILSIQQRQSRHFNENEEAFLVTLSAQLATALANAEIRGLLGNSHNKQQWVNNLVGVPGSPGVAIGTTFVSQPEFDIASVSLVQVYESEKQLQRLALAVKEAEADFSQMRHQLSDALSADSLAIFDIYQQLLASGTLVFEMEEKISAGWNAESALKLVVDYYVKQFESIEDAYIRERASDVKDLANRILFHLRNTSKDLIKIPESFILVATEVTPSMLADFQDSGLLAIISLAGSNNSHAAILARALGIPAVMGVGQLTLNQLNSIDVIVDGYSGEIFINPSESLKREYWHLVKEEQALQDKVNEVAHLPAITPDGKSIEVLLNSGLSLDYETANDNGAVGIGLYRTEIPFMNRNSFPTESEQTTWYGRVLKAFPRQSVTMRTLDVGGDKSLPYFPIVEDNPFLGWRGVRITLDHPEIFLVQVRAMLRANIGCGNLEIMLPMVSGVTEVEDATRLINQAYFELNSEYEQNLVKPKIGIMVEVPGVIFQLGDLAKKVDFFSVGSNDLTQYLLAVDRNNARVADLYDSYHPAVLRALNMIAVESQRLLVPLSLCGELAGDPAGAILLMAMGYDKLSMNAHNIARVKWAVRHVDYQYAKDVLTHCLNLTTSKQVHSYLNEQMELSGLGGFIRAGM